MHIYTHQEGMKSGGRVYQQQQTQIDNLTAQLMAADESMAHKGAEMTKLKQERDAAFAEAEKFRNLLPVLKAQVCVGAVGVVCDLTD